MTGQPIIDDEFRALIPPLTDEERQGLEALIVEAGGATDPLKVWNGLLLDGHNRLAICQLHNLPYATALVTGIADRNSAKIWILQHQFGRRNLSAYDRARLALQLEPLFAEQAKANQRTAAANTNTSRWRDDQPPSSLLKNSAEATVDPLLTRDLVARTAGVSHDTIRRVKVIEERAAPERRAALQAGSTTINREYTRVLVEEQQAANDALKVATLAASPTSLYSTIVIDPPWNMKMMIREVAAEQGGMPYPTMTEEELAQFPVGDMAADNCHIFCWTTQAYWLTALRLLEVWGFTYSFQFVWHKNGGFQVHGYPQFNCEFVLCGKRGSPRFVDAKDFPACFSEKRREHSRKPDRFYDIVRRVTSGPRIDVFSREKRDGFDQWGNETSKFGDAA